MDPEYLYPEPIKGFNSAQATQSLNLPSPSVRFAPACANATGGRGRCRGLGRAALGAARHRAGLCCRVTAPIASDRERCPVPQPPC